jgi:hypothetical protein
MNNTDIDFFIFPILYSHSTSIDGFNQNERIGKTKSSKVASTIPDSLIILETKMISERMEVII